MNWCTWGLLVLIVAIVTIAIISAWFLGFYQKKLFYPLFEHIWKPDVPYEEVIIDELSAWHFNLYPNHKTVLFCHGNAGNISHRAYIVMLCLKQKLNLLLFDYKGFGKSPGTPSQWQVCEDGVCAYNYLRYDKGLDPQDIIVFGESLGGAVATYVAAKYPCYKLILLSTFSSLDDVLTDHPQNWAMQFIIWFMKQYVRTLPNKEWITSVQCPIIILHSDEDQLIPMVNAERLYAAISHQDKLFIKIKGEHSKPDISAANLQLLFDASLYNGDQLRSRCTNCKKVLDRVIIDVNRYMDVDMDNKDNPMSFKIKNHLSDFASESSS